MTKEEQELRERLAEVRIVLTNPYGSMRLGEAVVDQFLPIIKELCYLKADGKLPNNPYPDTIRERNLDEDGYTTNSVTLRGNPEWHGYEEAKRHIRQPDPEGRVWASVYQW